jgi:LmbE family N-acetylglucosaminyl deacetylase
LVDDDEAAARVAAVIDEVAADTVLTFGPEGMTGHTDHIAASRWATRAVGLSERSTRLLYATHTPEWADAFAQVARDLNVMMADIELPRTPASEAAVFVCAEDDLLAIKEQAMLAQASQVKLIVDSLGPELYRQLLVEEVFRAGG